MMTPAACECGTPKGGAPRAQAVSHAAKKKTAHGGTHPEADKGKGAANEDAGDRHWDTL